PGHRRARARLRPARGGSDPGVAQRERAAARGLAGRQLRRWRHRAADRRGAAPGARRAARRAGALRRQAGRPGPPAGRPPFRPHHARRHPRRHRPREDQLMSADLTTATTEGSATETDTVVPTAAGDLGAIVRVPGPGVLPGVVLVDGSGDGDRHDWGGWPEWIADAGAVVLRHDKPGCGGSPGRWTDQSLEDRARESLAAVRVLRAHPATAGQPIGLYGISQGGWVALIAAALAPEEVDFIICHSGPGTTPAAQERARIETWLRDEGHD